MSTECVKLSVLVVSYNTRDLTLACLDSLLEYNDSPSIEVIVFDNNSCDGSADAIEQQFPQVHLKRSNKNIGFAAANNRAAKVANGLFLLLLNPDTIVRDDAISKSLAWLRDHPHVGILGIRTLYGDGSLNPTSCFGPVTLRGIAFTALGLSTLFRRWEFWNPEHIGSWDRRDNRAVGVVTGCYLMISKALWDELGGFDERFFMYSEDTDLSERVRQAGYETWHFGEAEIIHYGGGSELIRSEKLIRVLTAKGQFLRKHWSPRWAAWGCRLLTLMVATRVTVFSLGAWLSIVPHERRDKWKKVWGARKMWHQDQYR